MKLLALVPPGIVARRMFLELARGLAQGGVDILIEDIADLCNLQAAQQARTGSIDRELAASHARHIGHLCTAHGRDTLLTLWMDPLGTLPWVELPTDAGARTASVIESLGLRAVHWWLDAPFWAYGGGMLPHFDRRQGTSDAHAHLVNNPGTAAEMAEILRLAAADVPYGIDAGAFRPWARTPKTHDLVICAGPGDPAPTPTMLAELRSPNPDTAPIRAERAEQARARVAALLGQLAGAGAASRLADAWATEQLAEPGRPMLAKLAAARKDAGPHGTEALRALLAAPDRGSRWAEITAAVRSIDDWQRPFYASLLSAQASTLLVGAGPRAWRDAGWPIDGEDVGDLRHHELALAFSSARLGLNVMREQDDVGSNPKVLEYAASGCLPVAKHRRGLDDLLRPGDQCLIFRDPAEATDQTRAALAAPDRTAELATAASDRVRTEHTWTARAGAFIEAARRAFAGEPVGQHETSKHHPSRRVA